MNNSMKAALLAVVAGLAGCNGSTSNEPPPTSSVPVLGEGALQGYANGDTVSGASIYTNKDGKGYVLLSADAWVGAVGPVEVSLICSRPPRISDTSRATPVPFMSVP